MLDGRHRQSGEQEGDSGNVAQAGAAAIHPERTDVIMGKRRNQLAADHRRQERRHPKARHRMKGADDR